MIVSPVPQLLQLSLVLLVHLLPSLLQGFDASRAERYGDVERAVHVVVLIAVGGNLDEVLDNASSLRGALLRQNLRGNP